MKNLQIKISLFINYFIFAMLLNSVGIVILQVQNSLAIDKISASSTEAFKDLSIAIASFLVASFFNRIGYKNAMLIALGLVAAACFSIPSLRSFDAVKVLFMTIGAGFALIKMSVLSTIGLVTSDEKEHLGLMNYLESFFMIGIVAASFLFAYFINPAIPTSTEWFNAYYIIGILAVLAFILLYTAPLDESKMKAEAPKNFIAEFRGMLYLLIRPMVWVFVISAFTYVFMEQAIQSWLPTFNQEALKFTTTNSILFACILPLGTALGRFLGGFVLEKIDWFKVIFCSLVAAAFLVLVILPHFSVLFPVIGLLIAPIYPAISSLVLSKLPKHEHGLMSSLIMIFSALGGTVGSRIMALFINNFGAGNAFYLPIFPICILIVSLYFFKKLLKNQVEK